MDERYDWKPRNGRLFVFALTERAKIAGSRLYAPNSVRGSLTRAEDLWVLQAASDVKTEGLTPGVHVLVSDGFELEPAELDLWKHYENDPAFEALARVAKELEAKVETRIVHEASLLGVVEGEGIQSQCRY